MSSNFVEKCVLGALYFHRGCGFSLGFYRRFLLFGDESDCCSGVSLEGSAVIPSSSAEQIAIGIVLDRMGIMITTFWLSTWFQFVWLLLAIRTLNGMVRLA